VPPLSARRASCGTAFAGPRACAGSPLAQFVAAVGLALPPLRPSSLSYRRHVSVPFVIPLSFSSCLLADPYFGVPVSSPDRPARSSPARRLAFFLNTSELLHGEVFPRHREHPAARQDGCCASPPASPGARPMLYVILPQRESANVLPDISISPHLERCQGITTIASVGLAAPAREPPPTMPAQASSVSLTYTPERRRDESERSVRARGIWRHMTVRAID